MVAPSPCCPATSCIAVVSSTWQLRLTQSIPEGRSLSRTGLMITGASSLDGRLSPLYGRSPDARASIAPFSRQPVNAGQCGAGAAETPKNTRSCASTTIALFSMTALQRLRIDLPTSATVQTRSCGADVMGGQHGSSYVRSGKLNRTFYRLSRRLEGCASSPAVSTTVRVSGHVWRPDLLTQGIRGVRLGVREDRAPIRSRAGQRDEVDDCVLQSLMWGFRFRWCGG